MRTRSAFPLALTIAAIVLAAFALAACGDGSGDGGAGYGAPATTTETGDSEAPSGNAPAPSGNAVRSAKVKIVNFTYDPDPVTVEEGGKVIWQNEDSAPHTATAEDGSFDTGTLEEGKLKSESFKDPGTYPYICSIHPEMHGTVEVVPAG
jgi:plastocyanin